MNKQHEKRAKEATREILLKQIPKSERTKYASKRPTKAEENTKWRLVKRNP